MSLGSALNGAVSGLKAQGAAISAVSENIANASTTAYKKRTISFESLITSANAGSSTNQVGGGVVFDTSQAITEQGLIENTGVSTNIAISGQGFFVVTPTQDALTSGYVYTRNGDFSTDEDGLLVNTEGMILLGQAVDEDGDVSAANSSDLNSLTPIDLNTISGTAQSTTQVEMDLNLPADSDIYDTLTGLPTYVTAIEIFDDLGVSHTIEQTYYKTAANTWVVDFADPYQTTAGSGSAATGALDLNNGVAGQQNSYEIIFNGDGSIATIATGTFVSGTATFTDDGSGAAAAAAADVDITGLSLTTGADDLSFELDIGEASGFNGFTQFSSNSTDSDIEIASIDQDGVRFGQLSGVEIDDDGLVTALFDNGVRRPIYQIPIATFPNPSGMTNVSGTIYDENENAGNYNLRLPGEGNAGTINATSLELSTVDTSDEFNKMIVAQQAYSSAAQIVSTVDEMFETLLSSVR